VFRTSVGKQKEVRSLFYLTDFNVVFVADVLTNILH